MALESSDLSFWRSIGSFSLKQVFGAWDFLCSFVVSVGIVVWMAHESPNPAFAQQIVGNFVVISSAIIGSVLAGFAIATAMLDVRFSKFLRDAGASPLQILRHFLIIVGLSITSLVVTVLFEVVSRPLYAASHLGEQFFLGLTVFLFLWPLFGTLELVKLVLSIAVSNSHLSTLPKPGEGQQRAK